MVWSGDLGCHHGEGENWKQSCSLLLPFSLDLAEAVARELLWISSTAEAALQHLEGNDETFPLLE